MPSLREAVSAAVPDPAEPAAALALTYAVAIDNGEDLAAFGPKLLSCLESLLLTPKARATVLKEASKDEPAKSPLDELRTRRDARVARTPDRNAVAS